MKKKYDFRFLLMNIKRGVLYSLVIFGGIFIITFINREGAFSIYSINMKFIFIISIVLMIIEIFKYKYCILEYNYDKEKDELSIVYVDIIWVKVIKRKKTNTILEISRRKQAPYLLIYNYDLQLLLDQKYIFIWNKDQKFLEFKKWAIFNELQFKDNYWTK